MHFYPRPPRGGRQQPRREAHTTPGFLSTPSARRATVPPLIVLATEKFLSTPSARRATGGFRRWPTDLQISIHALREEGDQPGAASGLPGQDISIHALREEGDVVAIRSDNGILRKRFLSTPSARRATDLSHHCPPCSKYFYPRPPRGGRLYTADFLCMDVNFYPRPPRGGRPHGRGCPRRAGRISIHALREEGDEQETSNETPT